MAKKTKKKTREEFTAEGEAQALKELKKQEVPDRFISKPGEMVVIEEADPAQCTYTDFYGNPVDKDGNLLPDPEA